MIDYIDLKDINLADGNLGETWTEFIPTLIPEVAIQFNQAYNLISISFPDNYLDVTITHILIDESLETVNKQATIRKLLIEGIEDCLRLMGIILDRDYLSPDSLGDLIFILDSVYVLEGVDDLMGLVNILEDEQLDAKDRFIKVLGKNDPTYDIENFPYIIKDVAPNVTKGIMVGLNIIPADDTQFIEPSLRRRIKANKEFLKGSLASEHLIKGGAAGIDVEPLTQLFINQLGLAVAESPLNYLRELLCILIIANVTDEQIYSQFMSATEQFSQDMDTVYKAKTLIDEVKINV
jgi:hypothetical protein